jgi:hypothetical protein
VAAPARPHPPVAVVVRQAPLRRWRRRAFPLAASALGPPAERRACGPRALTTTKLAASVGPLTSAGSARLLAKAWRS